MRVPSAQCVRKLGDLNRNSGSVGQWVMYGHGVISDCFVAVRTVEEEIMINEGIIIDRQHFFYLLFI